MRNADAPRGTDTAESAAGPAREGATILVVDGEEAARRRAAEMLVASGFRVITSANSIAALTLYEEEHAGIDLVLLDMIMPGISGTQCLAEILRIDRMAKVVMTCGHPGESYRTLARERGAAHLLAKPYADSELLGTVERVLGEAG
ncbi:MAG: response regulator [Deltaproteobacteria bacterium]|nr:response regulator [Deltaproteobacteria bacterium]